MAVRVQWLEGLTSAEFEKAERLYRWASRVQVLLAIAAAAAIFVDDTAQTVIAAVLATLMYIIWAALDWAYRDSRIQAERGRRALLILDGLGGPISADELRDIEASFTVRPAKGKAAANPEFFASTKDVGTARLAELIEESGFYSCRLYRLSANWAWRRLAVSLVICIALFVSSVTFADREQLATAARLLCTVLVFLVSQEVLGAGRAYMRAHEALGSLQSRIRAVREAKYPQGDLLLLLSDYNSAVEGAPLMAPGVYKRSAEYLDELWRKHIVEDGQVT